MSVGTGPNRPPKCGVEAAAGSKGRGSLLEEARAAPTDRAGCPLVSASLLALVKGVREEPRRDCLPVSPENIPQPGPQATGVP